MRILDPKEEVYKIKITPWGKYLLSQGRFNPTYYAFFDDDIIYDSSFLENTSGSSEEQNKIQERILDETPRFEGQTSFQGSEATIYTEYPNSINNFLPGVVEKKYNPSFGFNSFDKPLNNYYLQKPLAKCGNNKSIAPFFSINVLTGNIASASLDGAGATGYYSDKNTGPSTFTSQVNFEMRNEITIFNTPDPTITPTRTVENDELFDSFYVFKDFTRMEYDKKEIFLKIEEGNTEFFKENFDIEVYEVTETTNSDGTTEKDLKKLSFVGNGEEITQNNVEYYFNIMLDNEIDPDFYCSVVKDNKNKTKDIFSDNTFKCPDVQREKFNLNIYNTEKIKTPADKC